MEKKSDVIKKQMQELNSKLQIEIESEKELTVIKSEITKVKIEFVRENMCGTYCFMTHIDGKFVSGSLSSNESEALARYESLKIQHDNLI